MEETVTRLRQVLEAKGIKIFAMVDHSGEAEKAGLPMPNTKLIIFGNPKAGTPLMIASPLLALDLPLKVLVWQSEDERVWVSFTSAAYLKARYSLPQELIGNIAGVDGLVGLALQE